MDFVNNLTGGGSKGEGKTIETQKQQGEQQSGGFMDKLHGMAGGGKNSEKNEDALDKGLLIFMFLLRFTRIIC